MAARDKPVTALQVQNVSRAPDSREAKVAPPLLKNLIDYAGLFPPAALDMQASVANYDQYLRSRWNWMLGRFIVPAAKLDEFQAAFNRLPAGVADNTSDNEGRTIWPLSVLITGDTSADISRIVKFNKEMKRAPVGRFAKVEAVEVKVTNAAEIIRASDAVPPEQEAYFEISLREERCFDALSKTQRRAKIRTGGETEDKFPSSASVIDFMQRCAQAGIAFKATAGLHHPLRSTHRYTYQPDSPSGVMHGFINVFLASAFLRAGLSAELATDLLEERSAQAIRFDADGVEWRGHRLRNDHLSAARTEFAISFGSCSFTEPVDDLLSLHLI